MSSELMKLQFAILCLITKTEIEEGKIERREPNLEKKIEIIKQSEMDLIENLSRIPQTESFKKLSSKEKNTVLTYLQESIHKVKDGNILKIQKLK